MKRVLVVFLAGILFVTQLSGCASVKTVANTMVGAAFGAVAGGIAAGPRGAIIGAITGAAASYAVTEYTEYSDKKIRSRSQSYNSKVNEPDIHIENSLVKPSYISSKGILLSEIQYSILSSNREKQKITEKRFFVKGNERYELPERKITKNQGTYLTTAKIRLPRGLDKGTWTLVTVISSEYSEDRTKDVVYVR